MWNPTSYLPQLKLFEGAVPYLYLDTAGHVTVGVGDMLPTPNSAEQLAFVNRASAQPATPAEIGADFAAVLSQPPGHEASFYRQFTQLELPDAVIDSLLAARVNDFVTQLTVAFPDFETYPSQACAALFDLAFNLGIGGLTRGFPTLCQAVRTKDWATAAAQCHRRPPISAARNQWTQAQFESAGAQ